MHRLLAAAAAAAFLALPALAQPTPPRQPTITVSGSAEIELKPDLARLIVSVVTQADTAPQAADLNKAATDRVLARIQALGVKRDDIRTVNIQVFPTPQRTRPDGSEIRVPRFTASHQLRILSRDIDGVGKLAGDIIASGDMTLHSVAFGRDNDTEAQDSARREAVKNARHQAEVFAQAAGVTLRAPPRNPQRLGAAGDPRHRRPLQGRHRHPSAGNVDRAAGDGAHRRERRDGLGDRAVEADTQLQPWLSCQARAAPREGATRPRTSPRRPSAGASSRQARSSAAQAFDRRDRPSMPAEEVSAWASRLVSPRSCGAAKRRPASTAN